MITLLSGKNFQCHADVTVNLGPATTIVGDNGTGKSALVRLLRWVAFNRPLGDAFVRHGESRVEGRVVVDGHEVVRVKGGKEGNCYFVDGEKYTAFGSKVPEAVARVLNLTEENFQGQLDPPFWFVLPPSKVAEALNVVVDLDVIDRSLAWVGRERKRHAAEARLWRDRVRKSKKDVAAFKPLRALSAKLKAIEALDASIGTLEKKRQRLGYLVSGARALHAAAAAKPPDPAGAEKALADHQEVKARLTKLRRLTDEARTDEETVQCLTEKLAVITQALGTVKACPACGRSMRKK
jgi:DNA repair ATPase RecN